MIMNDLKNLTIILVEPEHQGNIGAIARVMKNFGVKKLVIVKTAIDPIGEAYPRAMHARDILDNAKIVDTFDEALEGIDLAIGTTAKTGYNYSTERVPMPLSHLPNPENYEGNIALVFGRESLGLKNEELVKCDYSVIIPTHPEYPTMNISHAVSVILFYMYTREKNQKIKPKLANRTEKEYLFTFYKKVIDCLPLLDFRKPIAIQTFRNLIGRSGLTGREATTLIGIFRHISEIVCDKRENK